MEGASSECNKAMAIGAQEHLDPLQKEEEDRRLIRSLFYLISEKSSQQPRFLPLLSQVGQVPLNSITTNRCARRRGHTHSIYPEAIKEGGKDIGASMQVSHSRDFAKLIDLSTLLPPAVAPGYLNVMAFRFSSIPFSEMSSHRSF